jgi:hypothetical protein
MICASIRFSRMFRCLQEIYDRWSYVRWCLDNDEEPTDGDYHVDPVLLNPGDSVLDVEMAAKSITASEFTTNRKYQHSRNNRANKSPLVLFDNGAFLCYSEVVYECSWN